MRRSAHGRQQAGLHVEGHDNAAYSFASPTSGNLVRNSRSMEKIDIAAIKAARRADIHEDFPRIAVSSPRMGRLTRPDRYDRAHHSVQYEERH
jgi:hypothetical protein